MFRGDSLKEFRKAHNNPQSSYNPQVFYNVSYHYLTHGDSLKEFSKGQITSDERPFRGFLL
jgi:hypothetical protein